jgi:hypothetical protein
MTLTRSREGQKSKVPGFFSESGMDVTDHTSSPSSITVCGSIINTYLPTYPPYFTLPYFTLLYLTPLYIVPYENILEMIYFWTVGFGPAWLYSIYLLY